jgi:hypothetical protein
VKNVANMGIGAGRHRPPSVAVLVVTEGPQLLRPSPAFHSAYLVARSL